MALSGEECDIIVVDNDSNDDSVQHVEDFVASSPARLIANDTQRWVWLRR